MQRPLATQARAAALLAARGGRRVVNRTKGRVGDVGSPIGTFEIQRVDRCAPVERRTRLAGTMSRPAARVAVFDASVISAGARARAPRATERRPDKVRAAPPIDEARHVRRARAVCVGAVGPCADRGLLSRARLLTMAGRRRGDRVVPRSARSATRWRCSTASGRRARGAGSAPTRCASPRFTRSSGAPPTCCIGSSRSVSQSSRSYSRATTSRARRSFR